MFQQSEVDPRSVALLETKPPEMRIPESDSTESVSITSQSNDRIALSVNMASRGMVMLSEIWDPGWTATVDGQNVGIYRADYVLRGIIVGPGQHTVVVTFPATDIRHTLLLWLLPLPALAAILLAEFTHGRRRKENEHRSGMVGPAFSPPVDGSVGTQPNG